MRPYPSTALLWVGLLTAAGPAGTASPPPARLDPGVPAERELAGGEEHLYTVEALPGRHLQVSAEQLGADVAIELRRAAQSLLAVDSPTGEEDAEALLLPAGLAPGVYEVAVRSLSPAGARGRYRLLLEDLPADTTRDRARLAAERLRTAAGALQRQGAPARDLEAAWREAESLWRGLGDRQGEARALHCLAMADLQAGEARQALEHLQAALPLWESLSRTSRQADSLTGMGLAHLALGEPDRAVESLERALALRRALGEPVREAVTRNNLCLVEQTRGDLAFARSCYEEVRERFREAGEKRLEGIAASNLGGIYDQQGEPQEAIARYAEAAALLRQAGDSAGEARTLVNLAVARDTLGEPAEALSTYERSLARFRELGDRAWEARTLHDMGAAYYVLGERDRAAASFEQALAVRRELGDRRGQALTLIWLGRLAEAEPAKALYGQARELARAAGDRRAESEALSLLGRSRLDAGDAPGAVEALREALGQVRDGGSPRSLSRTLQDLAEAEVRLANLEPATAGLQEAVAVARGAGDREREFNALTALARVERSRGRLEEARARVGEALAVAEALRERVPDPDLRISMFASRRQAFELEIDLLMELEAREPGRGYARQALAASERSRARALLDLLAGASIDLAPSDPALRQRESTLLARLTARASQRIEGRGRAATPAGRTEIDRELAAVAEELDRVEAEIRRASPGLAALIRPRILEAEEVQRLLDPDTLLLEYSLGERRSFLWVVSAAAVEAYALPPRAEIERAARRVYDELRSVASGPAEARAEAKEAAVLSRQVLGPAAARLGTRRLVIVPDGALHYLPFAALPEPASAAVPGGEPLLVRHEIVSLPSASVLALQRGRAAARRPAPRALVVLADPVFDAGDPRVALDPPASAGAPAAAAARQEPPARPAARAAGAGPLDGPLARLPQTRWEAEAIARAVPPGEALLALGFQASRQEMLSPELARYRVVHLATHGVLDARQPELSGLVLSLVDEHGRPQDGFLSLADVYRLDLGADLVVLSGCETALGREVRGEGLMGLVQGFFHAGAARVAASLWPVEDRATAELMERFYRSLLAGGLGPAAALRSAQLAVAGKRRWRDPYYWSPFVLQGDWQGAVPPGVR
jgi:CHAT domain-containing protein